MDGSPFTDRQLASLAALGFERVVPEAATTEAWPTGEGMMRVTVTRPAMGTMARATVVTASRDRAEEAIGRAFEEMDRLIGVFSHYDNTSAASRLNDLGRLAGPPPELVDVMVQSHEIHRATAGAFDVSVAPVVELFAQQLPGKTPNRAEVTEALALVGAHHIVVSRRELAFARQGMRVTLDGIAKGYIVDAVAQHLTDAGLEHFLVEGGGDVRASGAKEAGEPWVVAVQDPDKAGEFPDQMALGTGAVATSGSYERYFGGDETHHHIVSAEDGSSPQQCRSVSVFADTAMLADALATGVFLMPPASGAEFVERMPNCEALIIGRDGRQWRTTGWRGAARPSERKVEL
jgi:thiamine biosynthesis lipoprotein